MAVLIAPERNHAYAAPNGNYTSDSYGYVNVTDVTDLAYFQALWNDTPDTARELAGRLTADVAKQVSFGSGIGKSTPPPPPSLTRLVPGRRRVLTAGGGGTWNASGVGYGMDIVWDEETKKYAMLDTGRKADGTLAIGLYYSEDGETWTAYGSNPVFQGRGAGNWDRTVGTPTLYKDANGLWHMFYEGFGTTGFEGAPSSIGHATATSLTGPWTRDSANPVVSCDSYSWIGSSGVIYHPTLVEHENRFYLFFNGGSGAGTESVGYAYADNINGPWTPVDTQLITPSDVGGSGTVSDPTIIRYQDTYFMYVWNTIGVTLWLFYSDAKTEFPGAWHKFGQPTILSNQTISRPFVRQIGGRLLMYAQSNSTTVDIWRSASDNAQGLVECIRTNRKQFAAEEGWGTLDILGSGGAKRGIWSISDSATKVALGKATGSAGSETEVDIWAFNHANATVLAGLGGITSSYPALKRSNAEMQCRLADDSADAGFSAKYIKTPSLTVATLPSASTVGAGARAFVTDASATTFMSIVSGGGANKVPVVSDGTNWLIG